MASIINGSSPTVTFSDGTTQSTSAIVSGYVPYANLPAGSVLQVVNATYGTTVTNGTTTFADTGLTATITPKFSTSKILVLVSQNGVYKAGGTGNSAGINLQRNGSNIGSYATYATYNGGSSTVNNDIGTVSFENLDSPATTSAVIYKTQFNSQNGTSFIQVQDGPCTSTITLMEIAG